MDRQRRLAEAISALSLQPSSFVGDLEHWQRCFLGIVALGPIWTADLDLASLFDDFPARQEIDEPEPRLVLSDLRGALARSASLEEMPGPLTAALNLTGVRLADAPDLAPEQWLQKLEALHSGLEGVCRDTVSSALNALLGMDDDEGGNPADDTDDTTGSFNAAVQSALGLTTGDARLVHDVSVTIRKAVNRPTGAKRRLSATPKEVLAEAEQRSRIADAERFVWDVSPTDRAQLDELFTHVAELTHDPEQLLRRMRDLNQTVDVDESLGLFLALLRRPEEALEFIDAASRIDENESTLLRYLHVDCMVAVGRTPERDTADMLGFGAWESSDLDIEMWEGGILAGLADHDPWAQFEFLLLSRGIWVQLGKLSPLSAPGSGVVAPKMPRNVEAELRNFIAEQTARLVREDERTRDVVNTGNAAIRNDVREFARNEQAFLLNRIADLTPTRRKQPLVNELQRGVREWGRLPQRSRDQLIAARYIETQTELQSSEGDSVVLMAIGLAVEALAKIALGMNDGVRMRHIYAKLGEICNHRARSTFEQLFDAYRNPAAHSGMSADPTAVRAAWSVVLSRDDQEGLLDHLIQHGIEERRM